MRIIGNAVLNAPADRVWAALNDPVVLARTIPGCERLEEAGPDRYTMTITAGVASIKGTYQGDVALGDPVPPDSFTLRASGAGAPGSVRADVRITLNCTDGVSTTVSYDADAVVGGPVGGVGQRVIGAVAKRTAAQFFSAVNKELSQGTSGVADAVPSGLVGRPGLVEQGTYGETGGVPSGLVGRSGSLEQRTHGTAGGVEPTAGGVAGVTEPVVPRAVPAAGGRAGADLPSVLLGASVALAGVLVGWAIGRRQVWPSGRAWG